PEPAVPPEAVPAAEDPVLLLGDVQHLLGEAVAYHAAGDRPAAERSWAAAVRIWSASLAPRIRERDAVRALEVEYAMGRLGDALRSRGGRAGTLHKPLDRALRELEPWLSSPDAGEAPGEGPP